MGFGVTGSSKRERPREGSIQFENRKKYNRTV